MTTIDTPPEAPAERAVDDGLDQARDNLLSSEELYNRWEAQQWSVRALGISDEAAAWQGRTRFAAIELRDTLTELEVGEEVVAQVLSALVDGAPTHADRMYLCTQMADEARHVTFFRSYLREACGLGDDDLQDGPVAGHRYHRSFEPSLRAVTAAVRAVGATEAQWLIAVVHYHLLNEGVLAFAGLQNARQLARRLQLTILSEGLTNVTRDEARHVGFGLRAARDGVASGAGEVIAMAFLAAIEPAVEVLVAPDRELRVPVLANAAQARAAQIQAQWRGAESRMVRQLSLIGLSSHEDEARAVWARAMTASLDAYHERWGMPHLALAS